MASKADRFYFENLTNAAEYSCRAANYLVQCMESYQPKQITDMLAKMHEIEHGADQLKHEMNGALARAFVTPVEREDLALISANLDDVTDRIEEVLQRFYVDGIQNVLPDALEFASRLAECCEQMRQMMEEFVNFKKPAKLHKLAMEVNHVEELCDDLYLKATKNLPGQCKDVLEILYWREIYDRMEDCADACEHVSDCIEMVVMKNT